MENITSTNLNKPVGSIIHHYQHANYETALEYSKNISVSSLKET